MFQIKILLIKLVSPEGIHTSHKVWLQMQIFFYSEFNQCRSDSRFV